MTRINASIKPKELCDQHLLAEYREITRVPTQAKNWYEKGMKDALPEDFRLGSGHVKFFYDKIKYLHLRFLSLKEEMIKRGNEVNIDDDRFLLLKDTKLYNDWQETKESRTLLQDRIMERLKGKTIKYYKEKISHEKYTSEIFCLY